LVKIGNANGDATWETLIHQIYTKGQSFNTPYGVDQSVIDDYTAYAHSVWPKGHDFFISEADLYEDETGQHAVKIELEVDLRQYVEYYLSTTKTTKEQK